MVEEEGSIIGAGSTEGLALEEAGASVFEMSRQEVIDRLSGNRRRIIQQGGEFSTLIERIDEQASLQGINLFTPPDHQVLHEPQG